ncbi:Gfo/Idh/MocA family protein [Arenibaculum pallidiluteum]|uniref:Gfo/Idh/MocA family protein n=1 Tax=Arenibaculum pallidiluteum TaxID=2812559 RepID=UPI001A96B25F|nr:Gfo/Idh/MocA family oxidoreductase [Arenibaculum pallidiluteum]
MKPVRWGILSTAKIGRLKVVPAIMRSPLCDVVAVTSRDGQASAAMAAELGIPRAYGSYEELLADPGIEAVYNPVPNHLHVPLTLAAARAGKHVLCEKPIALDSAEAHRLQDELPPGILVAEAFMIRHHPQWIRAQELIRAGEIGEVRAVNVAFSYTNLDPANIRNRPEIGGGGLMDIGCYAVMSGRLLFGADPVRAIALIDRDPGFGTDRLTSGLVDFGGGRHLIFTVSTQLVPFQRVQALGTSGRIEIRIPFNAPPDEPTRILVDEGRVHGDAQARSLELPACDQYTLQGEAFARAIRGAGPLVGGVEDAIVNMRVLDALRRSESSGAWEKP